VREGHERTKEFIISPANHPPNPLQNAQRCQEKGNIAKKISGKKKQKNQVGNLRRFERKFHNASLRVSFKIFPEAHPRGIMINVLENQ
jgi:hypothetical protein